MPNDINNNLQKEMSIVTFKDNVSKDICERLKNGNANAIEYLKLAEALLTDTQYSNDTNHRVR